MIEVLRQASGKLLISAGAHCVESEPHDPAIDRAIDTLAEQSGIAAQRIRVMVARAMLADMR